MRGSINRWAVPVVTAVAVLGVAFSKHLDAQTPVRRSDSRIAPVRYSLPECPSDWYKLPKGDSAPPIPATGLSLIGKITNVVEFHDCQKLLTARGRNYGPLVAIFAAYDLESLEERLDSLWSANYMAPERGVKPAHGSRPPQRSRPPERSRPSQESRPILGRVSLAAALILNLGAYYPGLDLQPGYSCLYLWRVPPQVSHWQAKIVWVNADHQKCLDTIKPDTFPGQLKVHRDVAPLFKRSQYPAVARWDWDDDTKQQYIGIKCGQGWCEVGKPTFNPHKSYLPIALLPSKTAQVQRIRGWYDEQFLAEPAKPGVYVPGVKGTVIPDESLGSRHMEDYSSAPDLWRPVAYIALSRESKHYKEKLNLDSTAAGAPLSSLNRLSFCLGLRAFCPGVPALGTAHAPPAVCDLKKADGTPLPSWWARIDPARIGGPRYTCAARMDHSAEVDSIPATARWRWLLYDETVWKECVTGCCQVRALN